MSLPPAFNFYEDLDLGLTAETLPEFKKQVAAILHSKILLGDQKLDALADSAYKTLPYPPVSEKARQWIRDEKICLLSEGPAPYHPRYLAPYYDRILQNGSELLDLKPARDVHEATASLLTAYRYLPSGRHPVFIGRLDELFEPYLDSAPESETRATLRSFWMLVDRLFPNAFVHANIGPARSRAGQMLLEIDREQKTITNMTLRYDPQSTDRDFALEALLNGMLLAKPYFLNHAMMLQDWGPDYAVASCYNDMRLGGGVYTLVRLNLKQVLQGVDAPLETVLGEIIPEAARLQMEVINSRIRYLVEEIGWFEKNPILQEGLLDAEKFTAYAGVYGLAEGVNGLMAAWGKPEARYGHNPEANAAANQIVERLAREIAALPAQYCAGTANRAAFHAQVGISSDVGVTPGVRVRGGDEPALYDHLRTEAPHHRWISGGVSTILEFDQTAEQNLEAVLKIVEGGFKLGIRNVSIGSVNSEYIRVSGYLMRRSDLEAAKAEKSIRHDSSLLAVDVFKNRPYDLHRRTREV